MKSLLAQTLLGILCFLLLIGGIKYALEQKIKRSIEGYSLPNFNMSCKDVALTSFNTLKITSIVVYKNADTLATINEMETQFDAPLLLKSKLHLDRPVLRNLTLHISTSSSKSVNNFLVKPASPKDTALQAVSSKKLSVPQHKEVTKPSESGQTRVLRSKEMANSKSQKIPMLSTFNYFSSIISILNERLTDPPERIEVFHFRLLYVSGNLRLEIDADKMEVYTGLGI